MLALALVAELPHWLPLPLLLLLMLLQPTAIPRTCVETGTLVNTALAVTATNTALTNMADLSRSSATGVAAIVGITSTFWCKTSLLLLLLSSLFSFHPIIGLSRFNATIHSSERSIAHKKKTKTLLWSPPLTMLYSILSTAGRRSCRYRAEPAYS